MFARSAHLLRPALARLYATPPHPSTLLYLEHASGKLTGGTLCALTAAKLLGGEITGVLMGSQTELDAVLPQARKLDGLTKILTSSSRLYVHSVPETTVPFFQKLVQDRGYTHLFSSTSSTSKSFLPRLAAQLDVQPISDVTSISVESGADIYTRPIYAGNAISTVKPTSDGLRIVTVRSTAFQQSGIGSSDVAVEDIAPAEPSEVQAEHLKTMTTESTRPELGSSDIVISGGRGLKSRANFDATLTPLADRLGAAIGASRAAVDAGYADNSLQVGQTGKIVAPSLYIAIGISGAIQHLAGMKDSKFIVAINKDPDAPIFQVADGGLEADLFDAVPELLTKLPERK
ncbi:electron transfer flavo protein alpha subunit [Dacryopinax primogenitus]|uniref:Probable electron transfer flavoprotein subunit alpha n=1 Tax=Dacryopinax primogenitus (strain DJM 731) TaxID=1858805 RepID=M5FNG4_DACPD|nr:electron transfer flavo protein alpha subunit [Dacryopinax primogenitus]EJT97400.1 electron transfer flavo protein alpha subunit [Dacryopinax primogenitus]